jgi:hypothetical protein
MTRSELLSRLAGRTIVGIKFLEDGYEAGTAVERVDLDDGTSFWPHCSGELGGEAVWLDLTDPRADDN